MGLFSGISLRPELDRLAGFSLLSRLEQNVHKHRLTAVMVHTRLRLPVGLINIHGRSLLFSVRCDVPNLF